MMWSPDAYNRAIDFAAEAHGNQMVPGKSYSYVVHLANVAMEVMTALATSRSRDGNLAVLCALLHDTIEDTRITPEEIEKRFGAPVRRGVEALTKRKDIPKEDRMTDSLNRILRQPPEVGMVKMADRITNLQRPPDHWNSERIRAYLEEAKLIHRQLGHLDAKLSKRLEHRIQTYAQYA